MSLLSIRLMSYNIGMVIITISNPYYRITDITVSRVCQSSFTDLMPVPAVPYQLVICELVISVLFLLECERVEAKRTARFHHKAVGGRHQVIIILRSRDRVDIRHTIIICRYANM